MGSLPHPAPGPLPVDAPGRLVGIDVARVLALLGMMVVHLLPRADAAGQPTLLHALASGHSSGVFAVLAGVGLAFTTGARQPPPPGRALWAIRAAVVARGLVIAAVGFALGGVVPFVSAAVILPAYGLMFVLSVGLLRLPSRALAALAALFALALPVASHLVRPSLPPRALGNPTPATLVSAPVQTVQDLLLTGTYPVVPWISYLVLGLALGRWLPRRGPAVLGLAGVGFLLAVLARGTSAWLLDGLGGRQELAAAAVPAMSEESLAEILLFGAHGTVPATSPWWLAVPGPHTSTPPDLVSTGGIALAVIGSMLALAQAAPRLLGGVGRLGRMPLTTYVGHLLLLSAVPWRGVPALLLHVVALGALVLVIGRVRRRGPFEQAVWRVATTVERWVAGPSPVRGRREPTSS